MRNNRLWEQKFKLNNYRRQQIMGAKIEMIISIISMMIL